MRELRWVCQRKTCQAVHHYKPDRCQTCGHDRFDKFTMPAFIRWLAGRHKITGRRKGKVK